MICVSEERLTLFLYILLRDHLPFGEAERILREHLEPSEGMVITLSEPGQATYARTLAKRILLLKDPSHDRS